MNTDTKYNGWSNYETWNVKLWLDNDQSSQEFCEEQAREYIERAIENDESDIRAEAVTELADTLESMHRENMPEVTGVYADLLGAALQSVDWREIAHAYIDDIELYSAGWNMPGYMPDNPPAVFLDADDALEYVKDQAKEAIDDAAEDIEDKAPEDLADEIDGWKADSAGEFGNTFGQYHYFVTKE